MRYPETWAEVLEKRISRLTFSIEELDKLIKYFQSENLKYREFDFKKQGLKMTAVEFFKNQTAIKKSLATLRKRRREILKKAKL